HRWSEVCWREASCRRLLSGAGERARRCPGPVMLPLAQPNSARSLVLASLTISCVPIIALPHVQQEGHLMQAYNQRSAAPESRARRGGRQAASVAFSAGLGRV